MSILVQSNSGWFICSKTYLDRIYESCIDKDCEPCTFKIRKEFYDIKTPFVMKSSATKIAEHIEGNKHFEVLKKKKRKNKEALCTSSSYVDNIILEESKKLIQLSFNNNFLDDSDATSQDWFENNSVAQEAAKNVPPFSCCLHPPFSHRNKSNTPVVTVFQAEEYIFPPWSIFHISDVNYVDHLKEKRYDLILLDPAWENKSVRRKKGYETLNLQSIDNLPIQELCNPGCLIIVWVTNNVKQIRFVREKLFNKWNVRTSVIWHWVKVTQKGKFIHSIDSQHKKPYENLILGRVSHEETCHSHILEPHKIIVSVPSSIHSHKPPLVEILQPYLPENPNCLELFARYLLPGWTSVGNEVLKLQNIKLFEKFTRS